MKTTITMKKNEQYHIDPITKTITLTKKFLKEASTLDTPENAKLMELMEKYPSFTLVERKIKKAEKKTTYKGLTTQRMKEFLTWLYRNNEETKEAKLAEFDAREKFYDDFHKVEKASAMKTWFLKDHKDQYLDWEKAMAA